MCTNSLIRERKEPYLPLPSQSKPVLIYRPQKMEGWVGLGTRRLQVRKQHVQGCYVTNKFETVLIMLEIC